MFYDVDDDDDNDDDKASDAILAIAGSYDFSLNVWTHCVFETGKGRWNFVHVG